MFEEAHNKLQPWSNKR